MVNQEQDNGIWADRYSRQIRFAPIGKDGQRKLADACVLIVGVGALGASLAQQMVRAGVGEVRLVDRDFVEPSNLQRQMLFDEADALSVLPKAVAAANKLRGINSQVRIEAAVADVNADNADGLADGVQLVLDGTDNAATRLLLSDVCYRRRIPFIYGGAAGSQGMSAVLVPGSTACLRCLIGAEEAGDATDTCDTVGVLAPVVEMIAALQASEAIKWLTGNMDALRKTWLSVNLWPFRIREAAMPNGHPECAHCGVNRTDSEAVQLAPEQTKELEVGSSVLCGRDTVQVTLGGPLDLKLLEQQLGERGYTLTVNRYLIKAQLPEGETLVLFPDGRVLVQGTSDTERAVQLCRDRLLAAAAGQ